VTRRREEEGGGGGGVRGVYSQLKLLRRMPIALSNPKCYGS
jgi:hypothetical protein